MHINWRNKSFTDPLKKETKCSNFIVLAVQKGAVIQKDLFIQEELKTEAILKNIHMKGILKTTKDLSKIKGFCET